MKKTALFLLFSLLCSLTANAQLSLEAQFGGSNFLGGTVNLSCQMPLSESGKSSLVPSIGVGLLASGYVSNSFIIHTGLDYRYNKWGLGSEFSGFLNKPFAENYNYNSFLDLLAYPNANYTFNLKSRWYLKVSAGAYFGFLKRDHYEGRITRWVFAGDVIPGGGLSAGCRF